MAEETPEVQPNAPEVPPEIDPDNFVSKEELEASISDISDQIKGISEKIETPAAPSQTVQPDQAPWESDPSWQPKSYADLFQAVEKHMEGKGFTKADVEEISQGVQKNITESQQQQQQESEKVMAEARKRIDAEVTQVKKEHPDMDKDEVFSFIKEWNESHPGSRITSFKDGFEIYSMRAPEKPPEEKPKPRLPGAPTRTGGDEPKKPAKYRSVEDALAVALDKFQDG